MKRELFIHFSFWFSFFVLLTLLKQLFDISYWQFWVGGLLGVFLPDIDHLLYVYLIRPHELSSQRVTHLVNSKEIKRAVEILYETRSERKVLVFHSILFQVIFFVVLFLVLSSSGSLVGRGLAISFAIHLVVDQMIDIIDLKSMENWFANLPFKMNFEYSKNYWITASSLTILMAVLL